MTKFTVDITDKAALLGITSAREAYNAALPTVMDGQKLPQPIVPKPGTLADDAAYVQMIMVGAAASYAKKFETNVVELDAKIDALEAQKTAILAKG